MLYHLLNPEFLSKSVQIEVFNRKVEEALSHIGKRQPEAKFCTKRYFLEFVALE